MAAKPLNTPLTAAEIAALCDGVHHGADFTALDVSTDSRRLQAGELFIALRGPNFRGEDFLAAAKGQGAVAAIVAEYRPDADLPQIVVADTLAALQALARDRRARSHAQFFAITGSNGKTSTKEILQRLLQTRGQTLATIGNLNNDIGVPLTLLRLTDEDRYAVIEMGANHPGEIAALVALARPDVALITNVAPAHLAGFGTLEGVIAAKSEIYAYSDGAIILNLDNPAAARWQDQFRDRPQYTYSLNIDADVTAHDLAADGSRFVLRVDGSDYPVAWQLVGRHNIMNALAACTADPVAQGLAHAALLDELAPDLAERMRRVVAELPGVASAMPVLSHGDLSPDQVLTTHDGDAVWLTDFDRACLAPRAVDLGSFLAVLDDAAFLDGYRDGGGQVPPEDQLRRAVAASLILRAADPLRRACRDWKQQVSANLDRIREVAT